MTQQSSKWARPSPTIRVGVLGLLAALVVLPLAFAPRAEAYVYWKTFRSGGDWIARADLNGTGIKKGFIKLAEVADIAVNESHIYWIYDGGAIDDGGTIGRAKLDGTGVVPDFFRAPGAVFSDNASSSLAVDSEHIYWTTDRDSLAGIGRAKLDGTGANADFISGISARFLAVDHDLAVDRDHIYWSAAGTIGRAKLDGTGVNPNFISGISADFLAVARDHIYWSSDSGAGAAIGRARIDGTDANESFITPGGTPGSVAVDDKHVYWTTGVYNGDVTISRAKLDGTDVQLAFIDRIRNVGAIAVDSLGPHPGRATAKPTQRQKGEKIVLKVKVNARTRLTAKASGEIKVNPTYKLRPQKVQVAAGKSKTLKLKPKKKAARKIATALRRGEKAKAKVTVKLTALAGNRETEKLRVRLKR